MRKKEEKENVFLPRPPVPKEKIFSTSSTSFQNNNNSCLGTEEDPLHREGESEKIFPSHPKQPRKNNKNTQNIWRERAGRQAGAEVVQQQVEEIFNFWNECHVIVHRQMDISLQKSIKNALKKFNKEEIKEAIKNYAST